ncbi:MAG: hypothetical protein [Cressdnaviricota sp.]|nr:MAG: hypothetical protein [Cressdnaviricota sp.]
MARRNNNKLTKVQNVVRFKNDAFVGYHDNMYIDSGLALSTVNRKLFSQERQYFIKNITANFTPNPLYDRIVFQCSTAGDTWSVQNAWTKAKALHTQMQDLVLDDMPSIEGKWSEFKVFLDQSHTVATLFATKVIPIDPDGNYFLAGEWDYSTFVMPQHDVDPATGLPLAASELTSHLVGDDTVASRGLVKAYAESRATVQPNAPAVPTTVEDSFYNLLSDSGSQEPELAAVIIEENDQPPYHPTDYPGGATNGPSGQMMVSCVLNEHMPNLNTGPFTAECGLIHINIQAYLGDVPAIMPEGTPLRFTIEYEEGNYKGLHALPMGQ